MDSADAAAAVERAVATHVAWSEHDHATAAVDAYAAQDDYDVFTQHLVEVVELEPQVALPLVAPYLSSGNPFERDAAGYLLGRLAERHTELAPSCSQLLIERLIEETDDVAREGITAGLGLVWLAADDDTPLELARHPNANVRFAAAHSLALTTTDQPDDADARAALAELLNDPDEDVRGWAEFGLETLSVD